MPRTQGLRRKRSSSHVRTRRCEGAGGAATDRELQLSDFEPGELDGTVYATDGDEAYCPSEDDDAVTAGSAYQRQLVWLRRFYATVGLSKTKKVCRRILDKRRHGEPAVSDECFSDMCKTLEAKYMYKNHRQQLQWLVDFYARNDPNKDVSCSRILAKRRGSARVLHWEGFKELQAELGPGRHRHSQIAVAAGGSTLFYGKGKGGDLELITELDLDSHTAAKDGDEQWLVEFYAPWCPHCQHFKPVYGQIARQALDLNCKSSIIKVGAVNCVEQKDVCRNVEKITSFPTVKLFNGGGAAGAILKHREPSEVIQAVSERWRCSDGPAEDDDGADAGGDEDEGGAGADDGGDAQDGGGTAPDSQDQPVIGTMPLNPVMHDVGEAVWFTLKNTIFAGREVLNPREGLALTHFLGALQQLLPQEVLDLGSDAAKNDHGVGVFGARILTLRRMITSPASRGVDSEVTAQGWDAVVAHSIDEIMTAEAKKGKPRRVGKIAHDSWAPGGCADVGEHPRGYTCGLWTLIHVLTVRAALPGSVVKPQALTLALHDFIHHFFACEQCRTHFLQAHPREAVVREMKGASAADVVLWWWRVHNSVSQRLRGEARSRGEGAGDPDDPSKWHLPWPSRVECGQKCFDASGSDVGFQKDGVLAYLAETYGLEATPSLGEMLMKQAIKADSMTMPKVTSLTTTTQSKPAKKLKASRSKVAATTTTTTTTTTTAATATTPQSVAKRSSAVSMDQLVIPRKGFLGGPTNEMFAIVLILVAVFAARWWSGASSSVKQAP